MNNISKLDKCNCTGCRTCEKICPKNAITMIENDYGFIEYLINDEKCVNCGICMKKCPQLNEIFANKIDENNVYAAKSVISEIQKSSSSGGIAHEISLNILKMNGVVYGCCLNEQMIAQHIRITKEEDLKRIQGSKYVQSDTNNSFEYVKKDILEGKLVLYIGTPCQIAGLKSYIAQSYDNLITIDLLCHGVPSNRLFKKYIEWLEEKFNSRVLNYEFRNKEKAYWGFGYKSKVTFKDQVRFFDISEDSFLKLFAEGKSLRDSCYHCKYTKKERMGDLTLGDFWGIEKEYRELYDKNGVSLIFVNSEKGKRVLFENAERYKLDKVEMKKAEKYADTLRNPCTRIYNTIYDDLKKEKINKIFKNKRTMKEIFKKYIPYWLRLKLRR